MIPVVTKILRFFSSPESVKVVYNDGKTTPTFDTCLEISSGEIVRFWPALEEVVFRDLTNGKEYTLKNGTKLKKAFKVWRQLKDSDGKIYFSAKITIRGLKGSKGKIIKVEEL